MLTCKEVVKIVSSEDRPSWSRKLKVRIHLFICDHCRRYVKQLEHLGEGFRRVFQSTANSVQTEEIQRIEAEVIRKIR